MRSGNDGVAEAHAERIRKAIADAEADGFIVDFDWSGYGMPPVRLAIVHRHRNWKEAVQIWPTK